MAIPKYNKKAKSDFIRKKEVPWVVTISFLFTLILCPGIPSSLFVVPLLGSFLFITILYPTVGLSFIAFTHSFTGLVRWKEPDALLLAGFGTILIVIFLIGVIFRVLLSHRVYTPLKNANWGTSKAIFLVWLSFVALIMLNIMGNWKGLFSTLMMFREYIIPLLLLPAAVSVLSYRARDCRVVLIALFLGSATVALINVAHYAFGLPIAIPRWITHFDVSTGLSTDFVDYRLAFGYIPLPRMKHLLGLSGAGAGGAYFFTMALAGYYFSRHSPGREWRLVLYLGSFVNAVAAFLTLSFSLVISFASVAIYLFLASMKGLKISSVIARSFVVVPAVAFLIFLCAKLSPSLTTGRGLIDYICRHWERVYVSTFTHFDKFFFGDGLGLKSGGLVGVADVVLSDKYSLLTDQWLLVALYQLGICGLLLAIIFFAMPLWMSVSVTRHRADYGMNYLSTAAGIIIAGFIGFVHGAAPIERLFSTPMMIAITVIIVSTNGLLVKCNGKRQNIQCL